MRPAMRLPVVAVSVIALMGPAVSAQAAQAGRANPIREANATGSPDDSDLPPTPLVPLRENDPTDAAMAAAAAKAHATGKPVTVTQLTTPTSTTVAEPHGGFVFRENVLPVRVRRSAGWVAVDTS